LRRNIRDRLIAGRKLEKKKTIRHKTKKRKQKMTDGKGKKRKKRTLKCWLDGISIDRAWIQEDERAKQRTKANGDKKSMQKRGKISGKERKKNLKGTRR